jgi:hypothetical protein
LAAAPQPPKLTEAHRKAQLALRADVLRELIALWGAFDITNVDESWNTLEPVIMLLITTARMRSSLIASQYYATIRSASGVRAPLPRALPPESDWQRAALVSIRVSGPIYTKAAIANRRPDLKADSLVRMAGAVTRHVLNGGRETLARYGVAE